MRKLAALVVTGSAVASAFVAGVAVGKAAAPAPKFTAAEEVKWDDQGGLKLATLFGDYKKGPYGGLLKLPAGFTSPLHSHSGTYEAVEISGTSSHWLRGEDGITFTAVYSKHQVFDCQLVLALATFAPRLGELGVREVKYGSAFRWSKVRVGGKTKNMLSRHALGIALDIVSFVDDTGREAVVGKDYKTGDELLFSIERAVNDSGQFRLLLTPKNDPISHKDHFHLEANPDYTEVRTIVRPSS